MNLYLGYWLGQIKHLSVHSREGNNVGECAPFDWFSCFGFALKHKKFFFC